MTTCIHPKHSTYTCSIKPDYSDALMMLAGVLGDSGKLDEGWQYMQQAAEVAPNDADVQTNMGVYLYRMGMGK